MSQFTKISKNDLEKNFKKMYWDYEQKFNKLNDGDLNGQDLWATDGGALVVANVGNFLPYEGAKNVKAIGDGTHAVSYSRPMADHPTLGTIYFAMRKDEIATSDFYFGLYDGVEVELNVHFKNNNFELRESENEEYKLIKSGALANQWYVLALEFDIPNQKARAKIHDGISWSAWTDWLTFSAFASGYVTSIHFYCWPFPVGKVVYLDTITPTDPSPGLPSPYVWGLMFKSQIDPEKIEEAINRLIAEHEADPESHLGEGESLTSHRAAEIIDHVVGSVKTDKFSNNELSWQTNFSDHAQWVKSDVHDYDPPGVSIPETLAQNQESYIYMNFANVLGYSLPFSTDYYFQFFGAYNLNDIVLPAGYEMRFGFGIAGSVQYDGFGFKAVRDACSVFFKVGATTVTANLPDNSFNGYHVYRAQFVASEQKVYFYIDGVEVASLSKPAGASADQVRWGGYVRQGDDNDVVLFILNLILTRF